MNEWYRMLVFPTTQVINCSFYLTQKKLKKEAYKMCINIQVHTGRTRHDTTRSELRPVLVQSGHWTVPGPKVWHDGLDPT